MKTILDCWFKKKNKQKQKTILDLPEDLVADEIISKAPIKSLGSVRSTCKKWNTLCKNRIFLGKEAAKKQFLLRDKRTICLMNFDLSKDDGTPSVEQVSVLDQKIQIFKVFQFDGLLLCFLKDYSRLVVWNPHLGQTRWIEPRNSFHSSDMFAFGHDSSFNYKILRISTEIHPVTDQYALGIERYEFSSSSWKVLDFSPDWQSRSRQQCVSLNGNAYFLTGVRGSFLCFDFTTERFGPLLPLPPFHSYDDGLHFLSFSCVRREEEQQQLALLYQHWNARDTIEISVTDKVGPHVVSWTKFLKVVTGSWVDPPSGSFLIDEEKKLAVVFVLEKVSECVYQTAHVFGQDGYFKSVRIREAPYLENSSSRNKRYYPPLLCSSYLPSLLQLNQPILMERMCNHLSFGLNR
ncbi:F-box/kelch-repeat protein [Raphanus sativus]|uniref:F-box/kelch-repeat protein At3g13680 n=1 Tax=Raphanus sativus TaxID=3726 RepID=A0A6J0N776_RAPSA|nr:F-box/kelch-repeat protein At3g13680 [Raphanus sativus]KAJ4903727.1 F-box/kelch-repeat protein [Raphanus sativus]